MSGEGLSWVFELYDRVSKPAGDMANKVGAAEKAMIASAAATARLVQHLDKVGPAAHGAAEGHGSFLSKLHDVVELAYEAPKVIGEIWEKAKDFAREALGEMRFKQDSLLALESMRGTRAAAIDIFKGVEDFAWKTGQGIQDVMRVTKDLLSSGISPENVEALRLFLADMRVVDAGKADQVAGIIGEIGRRGEMTARHILALSNAGIDAKLMWEELGRETGYSADALKKMEGLSVRAGTALKAIYSVGGQKFGGGIVGSLAEREAKTLPVLLERVREIPGKIIDELAGFDRGAGGGALEKILGNLLEAFDPEGPTGKRIIASVRGLVDYIGEALGLKGGSGLFAELAGPNGPKKIEEVFRGAVEWVKTTAIPTMQAFASSLGTIASAALKIARAVNWATGGEAPWVSSEEFAHPSKRVLEMARNTIADPTASIGAREIATRVLDQAHGNSVTADDILAAAHPGESQAAKTPSPAVAFHAPIEVHIHGNATKEDAEHIARTTADHVGNALEQHAIQAGGM